MINEPVHPILDLKELESRIFEAFYLCNEMPREMATAYAARAARIAVNMINGRPRADYFNPVMPHFGGQMESGAA